MLMECPECNSKVSSSAESCPSCGAMPGNLPGRRAFRWFCQFVLVCILVWLGLSFVGDMMRELDKKGTRITIDFTKPTK